MSKAVPVSVTFRRGVIDARSAVRELRLRSGRVVELAVAVEVPGVGERVARIGIARAASRRSRRSAARRHRAGWRSRPRSGRGCRVAGEVDAADLAVHDVDVEEVAARPHLEVDGERGSPSNGWMFGRFGRPSVPGQHRPDALARVVGEEQRPVIGGGERCRPGDRRRAPRSRSRPACPPAVLLQFSPATTPWSWS